MQLNPYLTFNGNCEEAFTAYAKILGGKIDAMMPFEGTPSEGYVPAAWKKKIMHACLSFGDNKLMGSDGPSASSEKMQGMSLALHATDLPRPSACSSPLRGWNGNHAARRDILGAKVRHACRPLWHPVVDQLLEAPVRRI
jgi:hypothetical protein